MAKGYLRIGDPDYVGPEPLAYRLHADAFLRCAEYAIEGYRIKHQSDPNMMQNAPIVHLICHAIEMLLKLALYKTGSSDREQRSLAVRHNLSKLKGSCEEAGCTFSDDVSRMIDSLSPLHQKHSLRYTAFTDPPVWLPFNPGEMIELSRKLIGISHPSQSS
ncbi:MAG: hypothetical protein ACK4HF_18930 [Paracoccaceae bacterium]